MLAWAATKVTRPTHQCSRSCHGTCWLACGELRYLCAVRVVREVDGDAEADLREHGEGDDEAEDLSVSQEAGGLTSCGVEK